LTGYGENRKPQILVVNRTYLFGKIAVGDTREKTIKVENRGTGTLVIDRFEFEKPYEENFVFKNFTLPLNIEPLTSRDLIVAFAPTEVQSYKTAVYLHSNSVKDSVLTLQFLGTGKAPTGVNDILAGDASVKLYPNPAYDILNVRVTENMQVKSFSIVDVLGREIRKKTNFIPSTKRVVQFNVKGIIPGLYFLILRTDNETTTYPFIVE
jgi:hypothetical protein